MPGGGSAAADKERAPAERDRGPKLRVASLPPDGGCPVSAGPAPAFRIRCPRVGRSLGGDHPAITGTRSVHRHGTATQLPRAADGNAAWLKKSLTPGLRRRRPETGCGTETRMHGAGRGLG